MASSVALRRAAAAAAAAASTTTSPFPLFTKYLAYTSTAAARSIATATTTTTSPSTASDNDEDNGPVVVYGPLRKIKMENPFQMDGPSNPVEVDEVKDGTLVRLTLPGVGPDGIKVWAENNTVFFAGKGEIEHEGENSARKYGGSLEFQPELNRADGVKAEIVNGILRLLVPNAGGGEK